MRRSLVALVATTSLLSACASLSEAECHTVDWHARGLRDGHDGVPLTRVYDYRQDCNEHGIRTDETAWRAGHQIGLLSYCTAERGYTEGLAGRRYHKVCPLDREAAFLPAFELGAARYSVDSEMASVTRNQAQLEATLLDRETPDEERRELRRRLREQDRYLIALRRYRDQLLLLGPGDPLPLRPRAYDVWSD